MDLILILYAHTNIKCSIFKNSKEVIYIATEEIRISHPIMDCSIASLILEKEKQEKGRSLPICA